MVNDAIKIWKALQKNRLKNRYQSKHSSSRKILTFTKFVCVSLCVREYVYEIDPKVFMYIVEKRNKKSQIISQKESESFSIFEHFKRQQTSR